MPKKKPSQPTQNGHNGAWPAGLALNNAGVNELAKFLGCSNWFAQELVRHGVLRYTTMGDRFVVPLNEAQAFLDRYHQSTTYHDAVDKWIKKYPGKKIPMPNFTHETELAYLAKFEERFKEIQQLNDELTVAQNGGDMDEIKRVKAKFEASGVEVVDEAFIRRLTKG